MDRSKLPGMTKRSFTLTLKKKKRKKTEAGAMDDPAMKRVKKRSKNRKNQLDEAFKY